MAKSQTIEEAVEACVSDGGVVAMEGFTHLIPHAIPETGRASA